MKRGACSVFFDGFSPGGIREFVGFDNEDDSMVVKRIQDCQPFIDRAHQIATSGLWRGEYDPETGDMWHVASIPNIVIEEWLQKGINVFKEADWPKVRALLNGDYKHLKTAPKTI